jgi:hypothetical protein
MKLFITLLFSVLLFASCEPEAKLGDPCQLLKPASDGVTKIELKNLDCMTVDNDAMCVSYLGNTSYCTQKCGPKRTCYNEITQKGDVICKSTEKCIDAECYDLKAVCSPDNKNGVCESGKKCDNGSCKSICEANELFLNNTCVLEIEVCSSAKPDGVCDEGLACQEGKCVPVGCPDGYECTSPIRLKGHTLKGMYVCVKSEEVNATDPCLTVTCSNHGTCGVEGGMPVCICDEGFEPSTDKLSCNPVN